jgi:hypothetical protein
MLAILGTFMLESYPPPPSELVEAPRDHSTVASISTQDTKHMSGRAARPFRPSVALDAGVVPG